ncbi:MAG: FHA domain-containing protein [Myxococcaceae bacterium]|jgi:pSer/pThr/pTyr-binding forkhead associated (FHA) protein|nr:FHA domain-containing protein [Myxococcaceae bacterium]MCA3016325.1 FHA domain-containing protein [Myxococcaceae bacterium]
MTAFLTRSLQVICGTCDSLNVVGAVRCMACGSPTDSVPAKAAGPGPRVMAQPVTPLHHETNERTVPMAQMPAAPRPAEPTRHGEAPPGLKRAGVTGATPALSTTPPPGSIASRGVPARPTFQSSSTPPPPQPVGPRFGLTVMAGPARGQRFKLGAGGAQIGRDRGVILFPEDPFISPLHATLSVRDGKLFVRDEGSTSGVYVSVSGQETISEGSLFCTGLRLFRYLGAIEPSPPWNRVDVLVYGASLPNNVVHYAVEEVLLGDRPGRCLLTPGPVLTIGQGRCDFSFPNDEGLAPRHCELAPTAGGAMVRDLSGGLGTYTRISGERALKSQDRLRVGQQTLQVELLS